LMQGASTHSPVGNIGTNGVSPGKDITPNAERGGLHNGNQASKGQMHDVALIASSKIRRCATSPERRTAPALLIASPQTIMRSGVEGQSTGPASVLAAVASVVKGGVAIPHLEDAPSVTTLSSGTGIVRSRSPSRPAQYYVPPVAQTESVGPGLGLEGLQGTSPVQAALQTQVQAVPTMPAPGKAAVSAPMCLPNPSSTVVKPPFPVVSTALQGWGQMQQGAPYGRATMPAQAHGFGPAWVAAAPPRHV